MEKYLKVLEFDKIVTLLKEHLELEENKEDLKEVKLTNNLDTINLMLDQTDEFSGILVRIRRMPLYFKKDLKHLLSKTTKAGVLSIEEILEVYKLLKTVQDNIALVNNYKKSEIKLDHYRSFVSNLIALKALIRAITDVMTPYGDILDNASLNLSRIRKDISRKEANIQSKLQELINKHAAKLNEKQIFLRNDRYCLSVKSSFKNSIRGIIHDESASGETVYLEPEAINQLNIEINQLQNDESKEITKILMDISSQIALNYDSLIQNYYIIKEMDLIFGKASLSNKLNGRRIGVNNNNIFELYNAYHPLLNVPNIVKNNVVIKDNKGVVITGPNTGGKTVLLKTIGLITLMVKFGLLVPADQKSNIQIFDNVYADIGDEQSIDQNLSTFSSHLKTIIDIMNNVTDNSLVLLDELGSGTDPSEGAALAIAIFDYLLEKNCLVIATTHYSELKVYAYKAENVMNASVEFDVNTLKPTYKLLMGIPGMSNALVISENLGLNKTVLSKAKANLKSKDTDLSQVLDTLTKKSLKVSEELDSLKAQSKELEAKLKEVEALKLSALREKDRILSHAEKDAEKLLKENKQTLENLIKELEENNKKLIKEHEIADLKYKTKQIFQKTDVVFEESDEELKVNDRVYIKSYNSYGTITKVLQKDLYEVMIGRLTSVLEKKYLKKVVQDDNTNLYKAKVSKVTPKKSVSSRLDLRGMRYEEAESLLHDYFDQLLLSDLKQVTIIHGYGTGVIRKLVQSYLADNKNVLEFRYGGEKEGGMGSTVVTLK